MDGLLGSIHSLADEGALGPGPGTVCSWKGCNSEPQWEVITEDFVTNGQAEAIFAGSDVRATTNQPPPDPEPSLVALTKGRYYCDRHARQMCLQAEIDLPPQLQRKE